MKWPGPIGETKIGQGERWTPGYRVSYPLVVPEKGYLSLSLTYSLSSLQIAGDAEAPL